MAENWRIGRRPLSNIEVHLMLFQRKLLNHFLNEMGLFTMHIGCV